MENLNDNFTPEALQLLEVMETEVQAKLDGDEMLAFTSLMESTQEEVEKVFTFTSLL